MRIPGTLLLLLLPAPIVVVVAASFTPDGYLRFPPGAMIQIPANQFCDGAKHWRGGTGGGTNIRRDVPRYIRLVESGKLNMKALAQRTYPLAQATEAYRVAMNREVVATIVTPTA